MRSFNETVRRGVIMALGAILVIGAFGCSHPTSPATSTFPENPVCGVFPVAELESILPISDYVHDEYANGFAWEEGYSGQCVLIDPTQTSYSHPEYYSLYASIGSPLDVENPRAGQDTYDACDAQTPTWQGAAGELVSRSGACPVTDSLRNDKDVMVWLLYDTRQIDQQGHKLYANLAIGLRGREGRDWFADANTIAQTLLNVMHTAYVTGVTTPTATATAPSGDPS